MTLEAVTSRRATDPGVRTLAAMRERLTKIERDYYRIDGRPGRGPWKGRCPQCDEVFEGRVQIDIYRAVRRHERAEHDGEWDIEGPVANDVVGAGSRRAHPASTR